jgi:signal transduction histidine kinase
MEVPAHRNSISSIWQRLVEPSTSIQEPEQRRLSMLLAASLIIVFPLIVMVGMILMPLVLQAPIAWQAPTFFPATIAAIASLISYWINRSGNYRHAVRLYIFAFIFSPWLAIYQDSSLYNLPLSILMIGGVLMASLLTPGGWLIIAAALGTIAGMLLLPLLNSSLTYLEISPVLSVIVTLDALIIILTYYRNRLEREHQAQLQAEKTELQKLSEYNEERMTGLIDAIVGMSSLDFTCRAPISERGDIYDAVAIGINALSEELEASAISRAQLEEIVATRTAQLEEANKELSDFAYIASHDLKAPLRAISQLSAWIVEDYSQVLDKDGKEKLVMLIERTKHMHNLIDGILRYSRIGRKSENVVDIDLHLLVQDIIQILDPPENIQVEIESILPVVKGEPTYLTQVIQNLLSNAIQYIDKPKGLIKIRCELDKKDWAISVSDNGPGIDQKYHAKIFQIFQTLGTKKNEDSTGIGLALVKRIVEKWGGRVWVESVPDQGSTFYFTIPRTQE